MKKSLISLVKNLILEQQVSATETEFIKNYVGSNDDKKISQEEFNEINQLFDRKFNFVRWMVLRIIENKILMEDIEAWKTVIDTFNKHKNKFPEKDINKIVTQQEVDDLKRRAADVRQYVLARTADTKEAKDTYLSANEISKLENLGVLFHGIVEGYQLFEIPPAACQWDEAAWTKYKDIMGQCKFREKGEKISLCTLASINYFRKYMCKDHPGSSYFNMYKKSDPKSPYQFHYESKQFKDKDNNDIDAFR
jgi:hypothetical protein